MSNIDMTQYEDYQEKIYYVVDHEDYSFKTSLELSLKGGNERRLFGKNHTKTCYNYYEKIKTKHRKKREEDISLEEMRMKKKAERDKDKLGGVNHFTLQEKDPEFMQIRLHYKETRFQDYKLPGIADEKQLQKEPIDTDN